MAYIDCNEFCCSTVSTEAMFACRARAMVPDEGLRGHQHIVGMVVTGLYCSSFMPTIGTQLFTVVMHNNPFEVD